MLAKIVSWMALALGIGLQNGIASVSSAAELETKLGVHMQWRSENKNADDLSLAMERLYVVLYNTGNIPTHEINPADSALPVEQILRNEQLFFGAFFPEGVDAVLCDLNPKICTREKTAAPLSALPDVAAHVGGYKKTRGVWKNTSSTGIYVPAINFATYVNIVQQPFSGSFLDFLDSAPNKICLQWQTSCVSLLARLNPRLFELRPTETILLPVESVKADIVLTGVDGSKLQTYVNILEGVENVTVQMPVNRHEQFISGWKNEVSKKSPADIVLKALGGNLASFGAAKAQGAFTDEHFPEEADLLKLIGHPFVSAAVVPEEFKQPVKIAVIDTWLDQKHCDLEPGITFNDDLLPAGATGSDRTVVPVCGGLMNAPPNLADDHGTHVVGLIAAAPNDQGIVGLNPFAKLTYLGIDTVDLQNSFYREKVAQGIVGVSLLAATPARVVNISWSYSNFGGVDAIGNSIKSSTQTTLFVVAAGNDNKDLDSGPCPDFPACYRDEPNVLTVVGLDRTQEPKLWWETNKKGSNWGTKFGIGAIAKDILSTTYQNGVGLMSGTSQAAPQVTAAASLLYSKFDSQFQADQPVLLPIEVKNRLIYTSDLFNGLFPKIEGGRLNIERALDFKNDWLLVERGGMTKLYKGKLGDFGPGYMTCRDAATGKMSEIQRPAIRRIYYDAIRGKYVIYYNFSADNRASQLLRIANCDLTTRTNKVYFEAAEPVKEDLDFQMRDIRDFTSAMFD